LIEIDSLGHVAQIEGEYARAAQLHQEGLALFRLSGEQHLGTAWALHGLGECALAQADMAGAREQFGAGLAQFRYLGDRSGVAWCLAGLGSVAALSQAPEHAARLWGAAEALRAALGCRSAPAARGAY